MSAIKCDICERKFLKGFVLHIESVEKGTDPIARQGKIFAFCPNCAPVGADAFKLEVEDRVKRLKK